MPGQGREDRRHPHHRNGSGRDDAGIRSGTQGRRKNKVRGCSGSGRVHGLCSGAARLEPDLLLCRLSPLCCLLSSCRWAPPRSSWTRAWPSTRPPPRSSSPCAERRRARSKLTKKLVKERAHTGWSRPPRLCRRFELSLPSFTLAGSFSLCNLEGNANFSTHRHSIPPVSTSIFQFQKNARCTPFDRELGPANRA